MVRLDEILDERLKFCPGQPDVEVLRAVLVGCDERQVYARFHGRGELDLRLFRRLAQPLQRQPVVAQVDALVLLELVGQVDP